MTMSASSFFTTSFSSTSTFPDVSATAIPTSSSENAHHTPSSSIISTTTVPNLSTHPPTSQNTISIPSTTLQSTINTSTLSMMINSVSSTSIQKTSFISTSSPIVSQKWSTEQHFNFKPSPTMKGNIPVVLASKNVMNNIKPAPPPQAPLKITQTTKSPEPQNSLTESTSSSQSSTPASSSSSYTSEYTTVSISQTTSQVSGNSNDFTSDSNVASNDNYSSIAKVNNQILFISLGVILFLVLIFACVKLWTRKKEEQKSSLEGGVNNDYDYDDSKNIFYSQSTHVMKGDPTPILNLTGQKRLNSIPNKNVSFKVADDDSDYYSNERPVLQNVMYNSPSMQQNDYSPSMIQQVPPHTMYNNPSFHQEYDSNPSLYQQQYEYNQNPSFSSVSDATPAFNSLPFKTIRDVRDTFSSISSSFNDSLVLLPPPESVVRHSARTSLADSHYNTVNVQTLQRGKAGGSQSVGYHDRATRKMSDEDYLKLNLMSLLKDF
jgi:hypothetical protein